MMVPGRADRAGQVESMCDRTKADVSYPPRRAKNVGHDVSWPASLANSPGCQSVSFQVSRERTLYHLNVFWGPPVLPREIGISSSCSIYQAGEVGHRPAEQRFVAVATFKYAYDSTLGPLVGECTDVLCEAIEKRGWNFPIVPGH